MSFEWSHLTVIWNQAHAEILDCGNGVQSDTNGICPKGNSSQKEAEWINTALQALNAILWVLTLLVSPVIIFAGWLLSPDWTSGDLFGLRPIMHNLWITVSNIIYFVYAILLIVIALGTIFGSDKFGYKVMLPRLALGILMVPFTWWFVQWTISLATVMTTSVVSIPMEVVKSNASVNKYFDQPIIPKKYVIDSTASGKLQPVENCNAGNCTSIRNIINNGGGSYASMLLYAYDIFKIQDIKDISWTIGKITAAGQLLNQLIIGAIMFIVFGILVLALIFMLMIRAIKLWMYAIFSPLFTLHYVAWKELLGDKMGDFSLREFIGLAFVPAIVGITLSFGLVVVSAIRTPAPINTEQCTTTKLTITTDEKWNYTWGGCQIAGLFWNGNNKIIRGLKDGIEYNIISVAGIDMTFRGKAKSDKSSAEEANTVMNALDSTGGLFGTIIIDIIALIFIWVAFMAAKNVSKAVSAAVQPFEDLGKSIGKIGASLPKYMPLPIPGGSIAGAQKISNMAASIPEKQLEKRLENSELYQKLKNNGGMWGSVSDRMGYIEWLKQGDLSKVQGSIKNMQPSYMKQDELVKALKENSTWVNRVIDQMSAWPERNEAKTIYSKWDNLTPDDALKLNALFGWATVADIKNETTTRAYLEKIYQQKNASNNKTAPGWTTTNNIVIKPYSDGKEGFQINTVNINKSLEASADDLAWAMKNSGLKGTYTKEELENIMKTAEQFNWTTPEKTEKLKKLIEELAKNSGFFKPDASK